MDFTTNGIAHNLMEHAPLIAGLAIVMWWLFPKMLNVALRNGSGTLIGDIVSKLLTEQNKAVDAMIKERINAHEEVEKTNLKAALVLIRDEIEADGRSELQNLARRLDRIDSRTAAIEAKIFKRLPRSDRDD